MAFNVNPPRKFTDLRQVYSHLMLMTDELNSQLNAITADSLAPDIAASVAQIEPRYAQTQAEESAIKAKVVRLGKAIETLRAMVPKGNAKNLLDNPDFLTPINQRGQTQYKVKGYTIDRWRTMSDSATISLLATGISAGVALRQYVQGDTSGMLTVAVCDSAGQVYCKAGTLANGAIKTDKAELAKDDNDNVYFLLYAGNTFRWAALYEGEYDKETLPAFSPRDPAAELLECQRYYYRMKTYHLTGQMLTTGGRFGITLPTAMRSITPTLTLVSNGTMICNGTKDVAVTGATLNSINNNRVQIYTTHATQSGWSLQVGIWLNGEIELSADL